MTKRNCVFTGQESNDKDSVIPRHVTKDPHNWTSTVPTTTDYKQQRSNKPPTELEIKAVETFFKLESHRLYVEFYERELSKIQEEINKTFVSKPVEKPKNEGKRASKKKDKEIEMSKTLAMMQSTEVGQQAIANAKLNSLLNPIAGVEEINIVNNIKKGLWDE